jgi:threonine dehydrogenase-like Zn-dependent dehydrogenase
VIDYDDDDPVRVIRELTNGIGVDRATTGVYMPELVDTVRTGRFDPTPVLSHQGPLLAAMEAYRAFDRREAGWTKVELKPGAAADQAGNGRPEARP